MGIHNLHQSEFVPSLERPLKQDLHNLQFSLNCQFNVGVNSQQSKICGYYWYILNRADFNVNFHSSYLMAWLDKWGGGIKLCKFCTSGLKLMFKVESTFIQKN